MRAKGKLARGGSTRDACLGAGWRLAGGASLGASREPDISTSSGTDGGPSIGASQRLGSAGLPRATELQGAL